MIRRLMWPTPRPRHRGALSALWMLVFLLGPVFAAFSAQGRGTAVRFPITLDYPLLRSLVVASAFPGKGDTATLINENGGCTRLVLSNPTFSAQHDLIRFQTHIAIQGGTFINGDCMLPVAWEGYLVLFQYPVIASDTWTLSFRTEGSNLYERDGRPAEIAGILWDLIKAWVYEYLDGIRVDLTPPVGDLKSFLFPLFEAGSREAARTVVDSLRSGAIQVTPTAVVVEMLADIPPIPGVETGSDAVEQPLTPEELARFTQLWESWDVLLVRMITDLCQKPLTPTERRALMDVLLDTRYRFSEELAKTRPVRDLVRAQFIEAWQRIAPVFRNHLTDTPNRTALGYLSFFTASDALAALDAMGPTLGIDISRDGLVRMARWLVGTEDVSLEYLPDVNTDLRHLVGFDAWPEPALDDGDVHGPAPTRMPGDGPVLPKDPEAGILRYLFPAAWAAEAPSTAKIAPWVAPDSDIDGYVQRVRSVLVRAAEPILASGKIPDAYLSAFEKTLPAMAWQESCFRQFVSNSGKITYLLSYNGTSVGLMQINERVWRGLFDLNRLRWDIAYNARAGCQIAALYIEKYVLPNRRAAASMDGETLARVVYAMYNGGPGHFEKFLGRLRTGKLYSSDTLFHEKLKWVEKGQWENINQCLGGH